MVGSTLGPYKVLAKLGEGGMGEVYRARDSRLERDVALKILPASFANAPDRLMRFEREAKTLAALNHPHIAQIYGLESGALVMELVEGETLADRVAQGPLPSDDALNIARQIAEALEAAHEAGIIHRDLKPANVKVRSDGTVKVLDFGLAKVAGPGAEAPGATELPTITSPAMTAQGFILGTAAYMAPEQAKGKTVDKRADIWAFGCVLYEMLSGRRPFAGEDITDTITSVLRDEPDWAALPTGLSGTVQQTLRLCLQKDPGKRLRDLSTARLALSGAFDAGVTDAAPAAQKTSTLSLGLAWGTSAVLAAALLAIGIASRPWSPVPASTAPVLRYEIAGPPNVTLLQSAALSPDGRHVVFFTNTNGASTLWVRSLDGVELRKLDGVPTSVSSVAPPAFSPDSRYVAFWDGQDRKLKRVPIEGGVAQTIADVPNFAGAAWTRDGTIVYGTRGAGLFRLAAASGTPQPLTTLAPGEVGHINPSTLPDGRHVLFHIVAEGDVKQVVLTSLDDAKTRKLLASDVETGDSGGSLYTPPAAPGAPGHLVYRSLPTSALMAAPLDPVTFEPAGDPMVIAPNAGFFALSHNGLLAYRAGALVRGTERRLVWMTRDGTQTGEAGPAGDYQDLQLSPDGRRAVFAQRDSATGPYDVWVLDLARGVRSRLTLETSDDRFPAWSADSAWLIFGSGIGRAHSRLVRRRLDGTGRAEVLVDRGGDIAAMGVSPDGQYALYRDIDANGSQNLRAVKVSDPPERRRPVPYLDARHNESRGVFMPGGPAMPAWVAYVSDETGRSEIYLQPFPTGSGKVQVSSAGGETPRWGANGRELFYVGGDRRVMAVPVSRGTQLELGVAVPLFQLPRLAFYDVAPDGRFLVALPPEDTSTDPAPQITVLANWQQALR